MPMLLLLNAHALLLQPAARVPAGACRAGASPLMVDDKAEVETYFNNEGFNRWNRIYSDSDDVNTVQLDIRTGHAETVDKVLRWVDADESAKGGASFCDAGCGVGSLSLPLAERGASVSASDISAAMVEEASARATKKGLDNIQFKTSDMEALDGKYDTVTCIDVMIHYPQDKMKDVVNSLLVSPPLSQ